MHDIAIIGFGATGVSFLYQLHSHIHEQDIKIVKVAIISPKESFSSGLAFGQAESLHKVNTPPELMGIDPEDPNGFSSWLRKHNQNFERYPPRLTYADYLRHIYHSMHGDDKIKISEYHSLASDIDFAQGAQRVTLNNGQVVNAKKTVLTLGSLTAPTFSTNDGYHAIPPKAIPRLGTPETALVAGTGLTAVDCVKSLANAGCRSIHLFSRNGLVPTVISRSIEYSPEHFTWQKLKKALNQHERGERLPSVIKLLRMEIGRMRSPEVFRASELLNQGNVCGYWDYLLGRADQGDLPFQDTLCSTRYYAHKIWKKLGDNEKLDFQYNFGAFWSCWRHPIPAEVIRELNEYTRCGRLHIHCPVSSIKWRDGHYILETKNTMVRSNVLIDGTGGSFSIRATRSLLLQNMLAKGLCQPHPCGGLRIDNLTYAVLNDIGKTGIYCLGPLVKGELFSTNAFWFNASCASKLAHLFAIKLRMKSYKEACD
ncbi:FAD/NAD(P)-binding protein [Aidingimonas halophila]|uniref:Uncharacterized NAD(P)/FAD-binding protein YdhS n=1 Tax=Aidingimonas halophila TaxID=574349 RepID=A0A1H2SVU6_9GAMM|nr:FAD/NAD(P)-binding protein [Aidingimonas halophila]GHC17025.1 hydroxyacylglutathione hydrolase [Aidingimonas halophila]SDW35816.1 Uncharacterized NAD(P)/FAD-binding protein YdhS [Aidingimonas halophila]